MKVAEKVESFNHYFQDLKYFLHLTWFIGILPVSFDWKITYFKFRLCSFSTLFSFLRLIIFFMIPWIPLWIAMAMFFSNSSNSSDESQNVTETNITEQQFTIMPESTTKQVTFGIFYGTNWLSMFICLLFR